MKGIKKIVLTGPESTGKSTLASALSEYLSIPWVPEYARIYLEQLERPYEEKDLIKIAKGQIELEDKYAKGEPQLLLCDTDLLTLKIWSEHKYGRCDPYILQQIERRSYCFYLLCHPDIPWTPDPQREHSEARATLLDIYQQNLMAYGKTYYDIKGTKAERFEKALLHISTILD